MLFLTCIATLSENIKCLYPKDVESDPAEYTFDITCTSCREVNDSKVSINRFEKHKMAGSRGEASFVMKCKFCKNDCSVTLTRTEESLYNLDEESNFELIERAKSQRKKQGLKKFDVEQAVLLSLDCRGCEVANLNPDNLVFIVELISGKKMECVFEDGENEWYDYDEDTAEEVSVVDMKFDVVEGK